MVKEWVRYVVPWRKIYTELNKAGGDRTLDSFEDLMMLPMKYMMEHLEKYNVENNNIFGFLLLMCKASSCQLGFLNA